MSLALLFALHCYAALGWSAWSGARWYSETMRGLDDAEAFESAREVEVVPVDRARLPVCPV